MDGNTLIHPNQVAVANEVFAPAPHAVDGARPIIAAFEQPENKDKGVISLDGRVVERKHADMAARMVALADAISAAG